MKFHYLLLALLMGCLTAQAQPDPIKFGKLELKEFDDKNFATDTAAEAIVMADFGRTRFEYAQNEFKVVFERVTRIKILKKSGYDWATVEIPLYHRQNNEERVSNLRGTTYNLVNGQLTKEKLESSGSFAEQRDANHSVLKFTLPNVKEGSVIEYTYTVTSDFWFNFQDWQFQHSIPVRWSEYRASIPEYFDYRMTAQGYLPFATSEQNTGVTQFVVREKVENGSFHQTQNTSVSSSVSATTKNYRWVMQDVPAFRAEPYITTAQDYVARIDFELKGTQFPNRIYEEATGSWTKINYELLGDENFGSQINHTGFLKAEVTAILGKHTEPYTRIVAIQKLVQGAVRFNGQYRLYSNGVRKAYEQHLGNSADINLLLIGLLRSAGLTVTPVILSTRNHGRIDENFPMVSRFNYVLAAVTLPSQTQPLLLDATQQHADVGMLPEQVLNTRGHLVTEQYQENHWLSIGSSQPYTHYIIAQLQLDPQGGWKGKLHDEYGGYYALSVRNELQKQGDKKYIEATYIKGKEGWTISKSSVEPTENLAKPVVIELEVETTGEGNPSGTLYLSPMHNFGKERNPFKLETRQYPVDFGTVQNETLVISFTLPDGYQVEELPKNALVTLPENGGRFQYMVSPTTTGFQIMSRLSLAKTTYSAEEYKSLREFYDIIVAKHSERIVIKRK